MTTAASQCLSVRSARERRDQHPRPGFMEQVDAPSPHERRRQAGEERQAAAQPQGPGPPGFPGGCSRPAAPPGAAAFRASGPQDGLGSSDRATARAGGRTVTKGLEWTALGAQLADGGAFVVLASAQALDDGAVELRPVDGVSRRDGRRRMGGEPQAVGDQGQQRDDDGERGGARQGRETSPHAGSVGRRRLGPHRISFRPVAF